MEELLSKKFGLLVKDSRLEEFQLPNPTVDTVWAFLLQQDLREIAEPTIPQDIQKLDEITGKHVIQVISVSNIAQPSAKRTLSGVYPKLLRVRLANGGHKYTAIEYEDVTKLSLKTPPGSKICLTDAPVCNGKILLSNRSAKVLDGKVASLEAVWKASRELKDKQRHNAADASDPPPPFVDFDASKSIIDLKDITLEYSVESNTHGQQQSKSSRGRQRSRGNRKKSPDRSRGRGSRGGGRGRGGRHRGRRGGRGNSKSNK